MITFIPECDVTLSDDLFADKASEIGEKKIKHPIRLKIWDLVLSGILSHHCPAPGCVVAVSTARTTGLHEELLTQSLLAELTPVTSQN